MMCYHGQCQEMCFIFAPWFKYVKQWQKKNKFKLNHFTSRLSLRIHFSYFIQSRSRFYNHYLTHLPLPTLFLLTVTYSFTAPVNVFSPWESQNVYIVRNVIFLWLWGGGAWPHSVPNWILLGWGDTKTKLFKAHYSKTHGILTYAY
jgi:hypothetical protein